MEKIKQPTVAMKIEVHAGGRRGATTKTLRQREERSTQWGDFEREQCLSNIVGWCKRDHAGTVSTEHGIDKTRTGGVQKGTVSQQHCRLVQERSRGNGVDRARR